MRSINSKTDPGQPSDNLANFRVPNDLADHNCVNMRLPTLAAFYAWEFVKNVKLSMCGSTANRTVLVDPGTHKIIKVYD